MANTPKPPETATAPPAPDASPPPATTDPATAAATAVPLTSAQKQRQDELARSGYSLPPQWAAEAAEREAREKKIAANMPSTDGSKPHKP